MKPTRKPQFNITFLRVVGLCMAVAVTIAIYLSTGALVPQPNLMATK